MNMESEDSGEVMSDSISDNEEYVRMERWLDDHSEFVHDYFARKAKRSMVDCWLITHALNHSGLEMKSETNSSSSNSKTNSKPGSGANTPVRKISAQEFDKGGILKPLVSTVDGTTTFIDSSSPESYNTKAARKSKSELKALDERELMHELVMDIFNDLDVISLCYKILQNVSILVNADRCSLFLVKMVGNSKQLVSTLFDVNSDSTEECLLNKEEIIVPWGTGIIGYVAQTGEVVNIPDAYQDPRFNDAVDLKTGYKTKSILSMPIKSSDGEVIGVAQTVNKSTDKPFTEHDEKIFASFMAFCGIGLKNAQVYERSLLENKRNQVLLDLARMIFEEQSNVPNLIRKIMLHTQSLLQCERCQVMLIDENSLGLFSQVFDLEASDCQDEEAYLKLGVTDPRFPINIGVAGYVASQGETVNIVDAYCDSRFDPVVDKDTNFRTHSILCIPIKNATGQIIGVSQIINKLSGGYFNKNDENFFEAFGIFCGMGISNTLMYDKAMRAMAKQRVALEVLSYHAIAPVDAAKKLKKKMIPSTKHYNLLNYDFTDLRLDDDDTIKACLRMFIDLDILDNFHIDYEVLCRWILSVKKNYRNVTYHNWRHAFNVSQTMFCILHRGSSERPFTDIEKLALMIGCLCHDLDHRGTNNQFQFKIMSPIAQLYSTSTLEHHHFDQCIMILSTKGSDILCNVNQNEYEELIQLIEAAILATDLAIYFRSRDKFFDLAYNNKIDWSLTIHNDLYRSMIMTACDIAAITKPWDIQRQVAELLANEFFEQGDIEKTELNLKPQDMMDRDKKDELPSMQVGFIDSVCLPVYKVIAHVNSGLSPLLNGCLSNRHQWNVLSEHKYSARAAQKPPDLKSNKECRELLLDTFRTNEPAEISESDDDEDLLQSPPKTKTKFF